MTWVKATTLDDLGTSGGMRFEHGGARIALFRVEDDVYAIGDRCSHAEAALSEGDLFDTEVECPLHGASFDLRTGKALTLPATQPVPSYPVRIENGDVLVEVS